MQSTPLKSSQKHLKFTLRERAELTLNQTAKKIFHIMEEKKTRLSLAADVTTAEELLFFAETLGPYICLLKTHIDIVTDFTPDLPKKLQAIAKKHRFLIFEDRKFCDIGNTVKNQYEKGIYRISSWADLVNAHSIPGEGVIQGLKGKGRALLLIAEMSAKGAYHSVELTRQTVDLAMKHKESVIGFITQHRITDDPSFIHMTPGIRLEKGQDSLGQRYISPKEAFFERGSDIIIVGRDILSADDPVKRAEEYLVFP